MEIGFKLSIFFAFSFLWRVNGETPLCATTTEAGCEFKTVLSPSTFHVVDGFLDDLEVERLVETLRTSADNGFLRDSSPSGAQSYDCTVSFGHTSQPSCHEGDAEGSFSSQVATRVLHYANDNLILNSTLVGSHKWNGQVFEDFSSLRHYPQTKKISDGFVDRLVVNSGALHSDTDFDGRCLSAVVFLSTHTSGSLRAYRCKAGEEHRCLGLQGVAQLEALENQYVFTDSNMEVAEEVFPVEGRLVFLLSETVHSVSSITEQARNVMLVWMSCRPLGLRDVGAARNVALYMHRSFLSQWTKNKDSVAAIGQVISKGQIVRIFNSSSADAAEHLHIELSGNGASSLRWEREAPATADIQSSRLVLNCDRGFGGPEGCPWVLFHYHRFMERSRDFWGSITGQNLGVWSGFTSRPNVATCYQPGDFVSPHTDLLGNCSLSVIWYLAKGWRPEWGGSFWWTGSTPSEVFAPDFNSMLLFKPSPASVHLVSPIVGRSQQDCGRIGIVGCYLAAKREV